MAAAAIACSAWRPGAHPSGRTRAAGRRGLSPSVARLSATSSSATATPAEQELLAAVGALGYPAAIFPGDEPGRQHIDNSIAQLEAASPTPSPLASPQHGGAPHPLLLGDWRLVYASSGTFVTRTAAAQVLLAASALPGVGVEDIRQGLQLAPASSSSSSATSGAAAGGGGAAPQLRTSNAAVFGLGPLGDWEAEIQGAWLVQDGCLARVRFDGFTLQLVGLFQALRLPRMAKVSIPIQNGRTADFTTTYLSPQLRVAKGSSGNIFLFERQGQA